MKSPWSIDDYLNRFRLLKARCSTQVPEHELVVMATCGLDYSIRKKLDTQYFRDMEQLAYRVRQVEHLKVEKSRINKYHKKEKVACIEVDDYISDVGDDCSEEGEGSMAELKPGPPYMCKLLKPLNRKNPVETSNNDKFATRTYTFDITKCDEIFKLLVADGQIVVFIGLKTTYLEQRKKKGLCKYHNFLSHKTSQCVLFRDWFKKL